MHVARSERHCGVRRNRGAGDECRDIDDRFDDSLDGLTPSRPSRAGVDSSALDRSPRVLPRTVKFLLLFPEREPELQLYRAGFLRLTA